MSTTDAKELLTKHGLWTEELPAEAPTLAMKPEVDELSKRLVIAFGKVSAADAANKVLLAKICGYLRRSSGLKVHEIGQWLEQASEKFDLSFGWICRLVKAGELLIDFPVLEDQGIDRLCTLRRIPRKLQPEVFSSGLLPGGQAFRELDREALVAAVNAFRSQNPGPRPAIPTVKARQEVTKLVAGLGELVTELSRLERFPQIQEQLGQWQKQLAQMLEQALLVPKPQQQDPMAQRAQYFIR